MSKISSWYLAPTQVSSNMKSFRDLASRYNNRSLQNLHNPFSKPILMKLPKNKRLKKPSNLNINLHMQSQDQSLEKPPITRQNNTNKSAVFDDDSISPNYRRSKNPGLFHSLSFQSRPQSAEKGTLQDIGTDKNRKKNGVFGYYKPNLILIDDLKAPTKPHLKTTFENPRAQRDKGTRMRNTLIWDVKKTTTYLQRYRASTRFVK